MDLSGESVFMWVWVLENLFQEVVQGLFFHHLAGSGRKKKTREINQRIFYMFGIWDEENLRQGSLQRLVFTNLAAQIMKDGELTREGRPNDQRGAEGMKRIAQGLMFHNLAGCGSRNADREKKGEQRATFPKKKKSCLFFFNPCQNAPLHPYLGASLDDPRSASRSCSCQ